MPQVYRAAWVLPIVAPPIRDGWVAVDGGRIVAAGAWGAWGQTPDSRRVILPGLVNAHTHLELSWMRGRIPPGDAMPVWASRLIGLRRSVDDDPAEPIREAIREARASGTALLGDVTNSLASYQPLLDSPLFASIFFEQIGFRTTEPATMIGDARQRLALLRASDRLRCTLAPHAPYSVSPSLLRAIGSEAGSHPLSIHLGESREEIRFLQDGSGPWRDLLESIGAWTDDWVPPASDPVEYLDALGLVHERLLAVHAAQLTERALQRLAAAGATVVTCPRSNEWTGAGVPPIECFYRSGVRVALGTDSLASVADLNLFNEMAAVRRIAPAVTARQILRSATLDGAQALGFAGDLGSVAAGKRADLIAVDIPAGVEDVEEYLVNGVHPSQVRWLEDIEPVNL
jgi:cytosine/adenosine deaminase-related metal-dependent hydrolase